MAKTYDCTLDVRGYELDSFGHVNHAVYISYLEHARWELLKAEGIGLPEFNAWKRWPVIAKLEVAYLKPTFLGDRLVIRSEMVTASRTSFVAGQKIYRVERQDDGPLANKETLVFEGQVTIVIVNEKGRPAELPEQVRGLL